MPSSQQNQALRASAYMVMSDFRSYADTQNIIANAFRDQETWSYKAALNIARVGTFSSDHGHANPRGGLGLADVCSNAKSTLFAKPDLRRDMFEQNYTRHC